MNLLWYWLSKWESTYSIHDILYVIILMSLHAIWCYIILIYFYYLSIYIYKQCPEITYINSYSPHSYPPLGGYFLLEAEQMCRWKTEAMSFNPKAVSYRRFLFLVSYSGMRLLIATVQIVEVSGCPQNACLGKSMTPAVTPNKSMNNPPRGIGVRGVIINLWNFTEYIYIYI